VFSPCGFWPTRQRLEYARGYRRFGPCALSLCSVQWPIPSPTRIALHSAFCSLPSILFIRLHPAASGHRKFSMRPQNSKIDRTADAKPGFGHRTAAPWSAGGRADLPVLRSNPAEGGPVRRPPLPSQSSSPITKPHARQVFLGTCHVSVFRNPNSQFRTLNSRGGSLRPGADVFLVPPTGAGWNLKRSPGNTLARGQFCPTARLTASGRPPPPGPFAISGCIGARQWLN
jgi:hypothetical protein